MFKSSRGEVLLTILLLLTIPVLLFFYATKWADAKAEAHTASTHVKVQLSQDQCPGTTRVEFDGVVLGCFFEGPRGIFNVFWTDHDPLTLSHELGHVYDATSLQQRHRASFMAIFGLKGGWDETFVVGRGLATASEWWAEAYARCDRHYPYGNATAYGYDPTRTQHRAVCRLIWMADKERNAP